MSVRIEQTCSDMIDRDPALTVPWYLLTSYAYYHRDVSLISDDLYDSLCEILDVLWDDIDHEHKKHVDRSALSAGTGYYIRWDELPLRTRSCAELLISEVVALEKSQNRGSSDSD